MSHWFDNCSTAGTTTNFTFDTITATDPTCYITLNWEELEWLPKSCKWKKYTPIWHLVRSYKL